MVELQIYFDVAQEQMSVFERMYRDIYVPALRKQKGYIESRLLRLYPQNVGQEIEAASTEYNYQIELMFDNEDNRRRWAASADHTSAWPQAVQLAQHVAWRGYDVAGQDSTNR